MFAGANYYRYLLVHVLSEPGHIASAVFDNKLGIGKLMYEGKTSVDSYKAIKCTLNRIITQITQTHGWSMEVIQFSRGEPYGNGGTA